MRELNSNRSILTHAIETFGMDKQLTVATEELSELIKEICKHKRGYDNRAEMIEEIADCYIMLEQIVMMLEIGQNELLDIIDKKCDRLLTYAAAERMTPKGKDGAV